MSAGARFLQRIANPKLAAVLVLLLLPFNLYLFPRRKTAFQEITGRENPIVDTWFAYPPEEFYALAKSMGEEGRMAYAQSEIRIDLAYPVILNLLLLVLLAIFLPKGFAHSPRTQKLMVLPVFAMAADFLENAGIITLLCSYPTQMNGLAGLTSAAGVMKFGTIAAAAALILVSAVRSRKR
jgi:hypothetical protein